MAVQTDILLEQYFAAPKRTFEHACKILSLEEDR